MLRSRRAALAAMLSALPALATSARAERAREGPDPDRSAVILVASRIVIDEVYAHTVIVARPAAGGLHVGVILNRRTDTALASLFPSQATSKNVSEPVFFGGPMAPKIVAAVTRAAPPELDGVLEFTPDLWMVLQASTIDSMIETAPNAARYYQGNVIWRPGELAEELERGLWRVLPASADIVFRKNVDTLWRELDDDSKRISA